MRFFARAMALAAVAVMPIAGSAQTLGTIELLGLGRYTLMSMDRPINNPLGVGGGLGIHLTSRIKFTADASYSPGQSSTDGSDVSYVPVHLRIAYELPLSPAMRVHAGAGYLVNSYGNGGGHDEGIGTVLGLRYRVSQRLSLLGQLTHDWMPQSMNDRYVIVLKRNPTRYVVLEYGADVHNGIEIGLAARLGGRAPALIAIAEPVRVPVDRVQATEQTMVAAGQTQQATTPAAEKAVQPVTSPSEQAVQPAPQPDRFVSPVPIYFEFDQSELRPISRDQLARLADILRSNPDAAVVVEGHADQRGTAEYNARLGSRRAAAVREFLISQGIAANRLRTESRGEDQPVDPALNEAAFARNRRVEFLLPDGVRLRDPW